MVAQTKVISPDARVASAEARVLAMRGEVARMMSPTSGTMHPEEILPQYEEAVAALTKTQQMTAPLDFVEATSGR